MTDTSLSKFLSLVLRHKPETINLALNEQGWAKIDDLLIKMRQAGKVIDRERLEKIVASNDKRRFSISTDGKYIRANQGHSINVELGLKPRNPPDLLYHGTATRFLDSIQQQGLIKGHRQHVHLSKDYVTALNVGQRHGKPIVLKVKAGLMHNEGHLFYLSDNGVWLTEQVPKQFLEIMNNENKR